jgi:hypothetical protein
LSQFLLTMDKHLHFVVPFLKCPWSSKPQYNNRKALREKL